MKPKLEWYNIKSYSRAGTAQSKSRTKPNRRTCRKFGKLMLLPVWLNLGCWAKKNVHKMSACHVQSHWDTPRKTSSGTPHFSDSSVCKSSILFYFWVYNDAKSPKQKTVPLQVVWHNVGGSRVRTRFQSTVAISIIQHIRPAGRGDEGAPRTRWKW